MKAFICRISDRPTRASPFLTISADSRFATHIHTHNTYPTQPLRPARIIIFRLLLIVRRRRDAEHNRGGIYRVTGFSPLSVCLSVRLSASLLHREVVPGGSGPMSRLFYAIVRARCTAMYNGCSSEIPAQCTASRSHSCPEANGSPRVSRLYSVFDFALIKINEARIARPRLSHERSSLLLLPLLLLPRVHSFVRSLSLLPPVSPARMRRKSRISALPKFPQVEERDGKRARSSCWTSKDTCERAWSNSERRLVYVRRRGGGSPPASPR